MSVVLDRRSDPYFVWESSLGPRITKTPGVCGGRACVADRRMAVWQFLDMRRVGMSDDEILSTYDWLDRPTLEAAFEYAAEYPVEVRGDLLENYEDCPEELGDWADRP